MAALLRHGAARKLGVSVLQRTQTPAVTSPAVGEERRWLVPRRMYSRTEEAHGGIAREVQQKIEELYDLINEGEKNVRTSTLTNVWLLTYLSEQVTPRPHDSVWNDLQKMRSMISTIKRAGFFSLIFVAWDSYRGYCNYKKVATMEEEHEASQVETSSRLMEN